MIRPVDLPILRTDTEQMVKDWGPHDYSWQIEQGVWRLRPKAPTAWNQALLLTSDELHRLELCELFHVSDKMIELAKVAGQSMPSFALAPEDLPSLHGFVAFEEPIDSYHDGTGQVEVSAASWGPQKCQGLPTLWVTWYTDAHTSYESGGSMRPASYRLMIRDASMFRLDGKEIEIETDDGTVVDIGLRDEHSIASWMATLKTCWTLMGQKIATVNDAHFDRATRRRMARLNTEPSSVRVITLRRPAGESGNEQSDREFHHRWIVRGHWRQQWLPSRGVHRPTWIAPHVKGPEDAPLLGGEKVYALKR